MHSIRSSLVVPLLLVLALGCATGTVPSAQIVDPLTITSPASTTDASLALAALDARQAAAHARVDTARGAGGLSNAQMGTDIRAENAVSAACTSASTLFSAWNASQSKPPDFDVALARCHAAVDALVAVAP